VSGRAPPQPAVRTAAHSTDIHLTTRVAAQGIRDEVGREERMIAMAFPAEQLVWAALVAALVVSARNARRERDVPPPPGGGAS
jgi:hypothetical protein